MVVICRVISDEKRTELELKRNNSVVNDLDVVQREEKGAWSVPGNHAHQDPDNGPHRPWCSLTSEWHAEWLPWEQMCWILCMHILFYPPPSTPQSFFHGWGDLTNGVLTLNSVLDGELHREPPFSTAPPDIVAQLNVNASESISLAQLELRRRWVCMNRQQCISSKTKGVFNANDLITNSTAHFVGPETL